MFIYGYESGINSETYKMVKDILKNNYDVEIIEYDQQNPMKSIGDIEKYVDEHKIDGIIGHSLGGFLALCISSDIPKIVINPCLHPYNTLPKLGADAKMSNEYLKAEKYLESAGPLRSIEKVLGLFGCRDELFDFHLEFSKIYGEDITLIIDTGHKPERKAFTEGVIEKIRRFLAVT